MDKNKSCFYKDCRNSSPLVFSWLVVSCFWYILVEVNFPFLHPIWAEGSREAPIITYLCVYFFSRQRTEMHRFLSFIIVFVCHWCVGIKWSSEFKTRNDRNLCSEKFYGSREDNPKYKHSSKKSIIQPHFHWQWWPLTGLNDNYILCGLYVAPRMFRDYLFMFTDAKANLTST